MNKSYTSEYVLVEKSPKVEEFPEHP